MSDIVPGEYWEDLDMIDGSYDPRDDLDKEKKRGDIHVPRLAIGLIIVWLLLVVWWAIVLLK